MNQINPDTQKTKNSILSIGTYIKQQYAEFRCTTYIIILCNK